MRLSLGMLHLVSVAALFAAVIFCGPALAQDAADTAKKSVVDELLSYGVLGVACIIEGGVVWRLYSDLQRKNELLLSNSMETAKLLARANDLLDRFMQTIPRSER